MANFHFCFKFTLKRSPFSNQERHNFATGPSSQILLVGTEFLECSCTICSTKQYQEDFLWIKTPAQRQISIVSQVGVKQNRSLTTEGCFIQQNGTEPTVGRARLGEASSIKGELKQKLCFSSNLDQHSRFVCMKKLCDGHIE